MINNLRTYDINADITLGGSKCPAFYVLFVQSIIKDGKEARRLWVTALVPTRSKFIKAYFSADDAISRFIVNQSTGSFADTPTAEQLKILGDYVRNDLKDRTAMFPISIIFQIVIFIAMELYRYWRDKRKYEALENSYVDIISTYSDNEYLEAEAVDWGDCWGD